MPNQEYNWSRLDNAAKLFPAVSTYSATNVFRLSARLYENADGELLQEALEVVLSEMPSFRVRLRRGLFWFYFEPNPLMPKVTVQDTYPCRLINRYTDNGYLFNLTYIGKYIHLEVFHALCDGTAASVFFAKILTRYLILKHPDELPAVIASEDGGISVTAKAEDSFARLDRTCNEKPENMIRKGAYIAPSTLLSAGEIKVIKGIMSLSKIKELAKSKNATVTELFLGILVYAMYEEVFVYYPKNKPIDVCVPVNLRRFFPSHTMRNFFTTIGVSVDFYKKAYTLDEVIGMISVQMKEELSAERLSSKVKYCVEKEKNIFLRFFPLFLKNIGLKITFNEGEKGYTMVLSNLGQFKVPDEIKPYIERFEFLLSPTPNSRYKTSACSYEDTIVYAFTSNAENTEVQRRFFTILMENGVDVVISSNVTDDILSETREEKKLKNSSKREEKKKSVRERKSLKKQKKADKREARSVRKAAKKALKAKHSRKEDEI